MEGHVSVTITPELPNLKSVDVKVSSCVLRLERMEAFRETWVTVYRELYGHSTRLSGSYICESPTSRLVDRCQGVKQ